MTAPDTSRPLLNRMWIPFAVILLAIVAWKASAYMRDSRDEATVVSQCRTAYGTARTAVDTLKVDAAVPGVGRAQKTDPRSCGVLRQAGKL